MKLKLRLNIGSDDARRLGLDKTLDGDEVVVDKKVAAELTKRNWAEPVTAAPPAEPADDEDPAAGIPRPVPAAGKAAPTAKR